MRPAFKIFLSVILLLSAASVSARAVEPVVYYRAKMVARYPHDISSYTQGLFFHDGRLYESTGQYGESTFREVDMETGRALQRLDFDAGYFVEGSVVLDGRLYILTWTNRLCFVYELDGLKYLGQFFYPHDGWGLTTDGTSLIASEGSSYIYFIDPSDFSIERKVQVFLNGKPVNYLNELEYIDGKIWANVYMTENILIIDPDSGNVEGVVDCSGLYGKNERSSRDDVFNGIAFDGRDGSVYVTGKYWKYLYKIELEEM